MKLDKTEREFDQAMDTWPSVGRALKSALNLEFKPEEPGLPERVRVEMGVLLRPEDSSHGLGRFSDEYLDALYLEAAARYNAVESILTPDDDFISVNRIRRVLREEREKLQ